MKSIIIRPAFFTLLLTLVARSSWIPLPAAPRAFDAAAALKSLPGAEWKELEAKAPFKRVFEIRLSQPLDHAAPAGEAFKQKLILSLVDETRPVVLVTEGYALGENHIQELSEMLGANQLRVEHRFFGDSKPAAMKWPFLTLKQACDDDHRIVTLFQRFLKGKWISTGWSKGGQTALTFRCYYPDDVAATVAYDAPMNFSTAEPRIDRFFETVGTEECRQRLITFQRLMLQNEAALLPLFAKAAEEKKQAFSSIGEKKALEYAVLEYPFSFWQYHAIDCSTVPGSGASAEEMFAHLRRVVSLGAYADAAMNSPSMYQFYTELGYYEYVTKNVRDLLPPGSYPNRAYAPQNVLLSYDPGIMRHVADWLQHQGRNIIYIYGERDPWSACQVELIPGKTNAMKKILPGGNHFTFIRTFPPAEGQEMIAALSRWLAE